MRDNLAILLFFVGGGAEMRIVTIGESTVGSLYYAELKLCEVIYQHINLCYHHR